MDRNAPLALLIAGLCLVSVGGCGGSEETIRSTPSARGSGMQELPAPTPGSKEAAPGVPTSEGGDNSIQLWGMEAGSGERAEGAAIIQAYLDARADGNWSKACGLLAPRSRAEQSYIVGGLPCPRATAILLKRASTQRLSEEAQIAPLSFRVGDKYAFLIYRRTDGVYAMGMIRRHGGWKVVSATPNPLS